MHFIAEHRRCRSARPRRSGACLASGKSSAGYPGAAKRASENGAAASICGAHATSAGWKRNVVANATWRLPQV